MGVKFLLLKSRVGFMISSMTLPFSFLKPLSTIYYTYTATVHTKQSHTGLTLLSIKYPQHKYLTRKCSCFTFINTKPQMEVHSKMLFKSKSLKVEFFSCEEAALEVLLLSQCLKAKFSPCNALVMSVPCTFRQCTYKILYFHQYVCHVHMLGSVQGQTLHYCSCLMSVPVHSWFCEMLGPSNFLLKCNGLSVPVHSFFYVWYIHLSVCVCVCVSV